ncbi:MAG: hypothetical protein ACFHWZ_08540 [Phycisphaerales bacterium]
MTTRSVTARSLVLLCGLAAATPVALAQDSVASTPGNSDALSAYAQQNVRYVVDLVDFTSSWGNAFAIAPVLKASRDVDPFFPTQVAGSAAVSPNQLTGTVPGASDFAFWTSAGAGVNTSQNTAAGSVSVATFDAQFALALSDFSTNASNVIGATVGRTDADPNRLFVDRTVAMVSRPGATLADLSTLSLGSVDAEGTVFLRRRLQHLRLQLRARREHHPRRTARPLGAINAPFDNSGTNAVSDPASSTFVANDDTVTLNTPGAIPGATAVVFDFAGDYRPDANAPVAHLDPAIEAHRGNPSFSLATPLGGVGTVGSIARFAGQPTGVNIFGVTESGLVTGTASAVLPSPLVSGSFVANDARFTQYLSQTSFRGPNGQVGVGTDASGDAVVAATATDESAGDFIAVARIGSSTSWTVAAHAASPVLDGPGGSVIGILVAGSQPVSISAPAVDLLGNIYFLSAYQPDGGAETVGLFKAIPTGGVYELELLVAEGDSFTGANSATEYTVTDLTLADSDSLASGSFHAGSIIQQTVTGFAGSIPSDPGTFGGLIVNAEITYDRDGVPEAYNATLFVGPGSGAANCLGDTNADGIVDLADLNAVLANFGQSTASGDVTGDGQVDLADLNLVLANFGACNPA